MWEPPPTERTVGVNTTILSERERGSGSIEEDLDVKL